MTGLFDGLIGEAKDLLSPFPCRPLPTGRPAREGDPNQLLLRRDTAYELGEGSFPSVSFTAVTQDPQLAAEDGVFLWGRDLREIREDCAFARITVLRTDDIYAAGDQAAYNLIRTLEAQRFQVAPEGYMVRASALNNREQVRVSRKALRQGLSFANVGALLLCRLHANRHVLAAQVWFITLPEAPYRQLDALADRVSAVTRTLNHMLDDVSMDCRACEWKPVCDTVEGLKELHQRRVQKTETP